MLGIEDTSVLAAYVLSVLSAGVCIAYGAAMWNRGGDNAGGGEAEEMHWAKEERGIEEEF